MRFVCLVALTVLAVSCSHGPTESWATGEVASDAGYEASLARLDSLVAGSPAPRSASDSLSYFLGMCEGLTYQERLDKIPTDQRGEMNTGDYLLGVQSVLTADTASTSYAAGVRIGMEASRYLSTLEAQGVKINRRLLAATVETMLNNPALDSVTKNHADSIAGAIIRRNQKL